MSEFSSHYCIRGTKATTGVLPLGTTCKYPRGGAASDSETTRPTSIKPTPNLSITPMQRIIRVSPLQHLHASVQLITNRRDRVGSGCSAQSVLAGYMPSHHRCKQKSALVAKVPALVIERPDKGVSAHSTNDQKHAILGL